MRSADRFHQPIIRDQFARCNSYLRILIDESIVFERCFVMRSEVSDLGSFIIKDHTLIKKMDYFQKYYLVV
jgi:hypothetical protein